MNKTKRAIAGIFGAALAASITTTAFAATEHWNDASTAAPSEWSHWKQDWGTIKNDYEQVSLTPGANETQLNFAWYSKTVETPAVRISKSADMSGAVEFGGTQSEITEAAALGYFSNKVTVKDLEENTQYYYQVFKNGAWSEACRYSTKSFDSYSILYVGDPQIGACKGQTSTEGDEMADEIAARNDAFNWNRTLENALSAHPDVSFMVSAGDQVNAAEREYEYAGYLFPSVLDSLPVSTTIGNHDSGSYQYSRHFNNPNSFELSDSEYTLGHTAAGSDYYYTYGSVLFIVIDTNNYNCATHKAVIEKAISENPDAKWRVVMFHQDIYGSGLDHSDSDGIVLRTQLTPIFDDNDIDIVLQGHDHTYSRTYQLSGDGKSHAAYDNKNWRDENKNPVANFLTENNCYNIRTDAADGNRVVDPEGTVYIEANSSTGSKFYELIPAQQDYIAERSQTWTPSYSVIDFSDNEATITTYDALTNKVLENSAPYTIVKTGNKSTASNNTEKSDSAENNSNTGNDNKTNPSTGVADAAPIAGIIALAGITAIVINGVKRSK